MPNFNANQAALAGKAAAFGALFTTFCGVTDPATAFVLALIATLVLSAAG
jgi:hypothetical protein